ncbi:fatty acid desaturase [Chthonobacter albigriseus]|uniref:fatty acid desaturase n=1 Tax=Chthonobacter albigriseus TaxID=1683161 RepID=UPI0015EF894A|nr:fatty acid desaturase [Chthonobacter albigriseus]
MEDVFVRRDLIQPDTLRALSIKSDRAGWIQLGSHAAAIVGTGILLSLTWGSWVAVPVFIAHGILLNFLYAGQHEFSHWTVFKTKKLNEICGRAIGFLMLYPRDFDQIQHFAHHRFTQDWAKDGELGRPKFTFMSYILWLLGPTYWYSRIRRLFRFTAGIVTEPYVPDDRKAGLILEARIHMAGYALIALVSLAAGSWAAVTYWLAPLILTKGFHQLQNTIEHIGLSHESNILENTRSTRTNAFMRWLGWNMQYHTAHHAFPGVPFHKLPDLDQTIFGKNGIEPHRMGYFEFQRSVLDALWHVRSEAEFPDDLSWVDEKKMKAATAAAAE